MNRPPAERPPLTPALGGAEFLRWYWLKEELAGFARSLGQKATGSKALLTQRIAAALDGRPFAEPASPKQRQGPQLTEPLSGSMPIPAGQRCSQAVRRWMSGQLGAGFHFDAAMRGFFAGVDGTQTLQDAVDHWRATRTAGSREIDPQFEYNRFTRTWHTANPNGTREEVLAAWQVYRSRPVDERGRI